MVPQAGPFPAGGVFGVHAAAAVRRPARTAADPQAFFLADDPYGWPSREYEEAVELRPGLATDRRPGARMPAHLGRASRPTASPEPSCVDNPYWPPELAQHAGPLPHERYVILAPLALSRTQDDKGRVRWTLFGSSEQGPERAFWKASITRPA